MDKVIRDGKVAVLVSYGFGSGWYSWNTENKEILFHPKLIEMVENGNRDEIDEYWVLKNLGIADIYCGGANGLNIQWVKEGTAFAIEEYDGAETLKTIDSLTIIA